MAFLAAPTLATSPNEPRQGAAVKSTKLLKPTAPIVLTRQPLPAPGVGSLVNLSNGTPV